MTLRVICPHCHSPIDPLMFDAAVSAAAQYRICPECDGAIVLLSLEGEDETETSPAAAPHAPPALFGAANGIPHEHGFSC